MRPIIKAKQFVRTRFQREKEPYFDIYRKGKRRYEILGKEYHLSGNKEMDAHILKKIEGLRLKREQEIQSLVYDDLPQVRLNVDLVDYIEKIIQSRPTRAKTWLNVLYHLKKFQSGKIRFRDINEDWLEEFKKHLLNTLAINSAHTYYSLLKHALAKAVKDKIISSNPANNVDSIKRRETERSYLTLDEIKKLAKTKCKNEDVRNAFLFCCFVGLRISDVMNLTWGDVKEDALTFRQKKTDALTYLPLSEQAIEFMGERKPDCEKIFKLFSNDYTNKVLKHWATHAGIGKHITFHSARHTFATLSLSSGIDIYTTSKLMGHSSLKHTQVYARIIDSAKMTAVKKLPRL